LFSVKPPPAWSEPRTAIVTGGGSGIGLAIANRLAAEGATVAIWDRDGATAEAAAKGIEAEGGKALAFPVDITDRSAIDAAVAELRDGAGAATIIVNNAGISPFKKFLEIERAELQQVIDVNVIGTFDCCQAVVPDMISAGWGRIVNIASSSAQTGSPLQTHYSASKGAVIALTRSLAVALGPKGITANAVPPSVIDTPGLRTAEEGGFLGPNRALLEKSVPVRRMGQPEDIAAMCAFLTRDDAGFITGQVMGVNGGRVIGG
jgi:2-hydroxycyclohexanecarboxyl-CoA dehydrogenase